MKNNYEKFIFDMDGTLVDSKEAVEKAWRIWANKHHLNVEDILAISHGRPCEDVINQLMPQLDTAQEALKLEQTEMDNVASVTAISGAVEFVSRLSEQDWGIFTSAPRNLAIERLKAAGIPIPKILITVEDICKGKPDPEGYLLAAQKLGVTSDKCLVFEDAEAGINSALSAGCDVIKICVASPDSSSTGNYLSVHDYFDVSVYLNEQRISLKPS